MGGWRGGRLQFAVVFAFGILLGHSISVLLSFSPSGIDAPHPPASPRDPAKAEALKLDLVQRMKLQESATVHRLQETIKERS